MEKKVRHADMCTGGAIGDRREGSRFVRERTADPADPTGAHSKKQNKEYLIFYFL